MAYSSLTYGLANRLSSNQFAGLDWLAVGGEQTLENDFVHCVRVCLVPPHFYRVATRLGELLLVSTEFF
jgi:hypothetical protein